MWNKISVLFAVGLYSTAF